VAANYERIFQAEPFEIIRIADARSLAEGYNRGIAQSRGDRIILSHDDIQILNPNACDKIKGHLDRFDLIGVAGTSRLICGEWVRAGPPYIHGQVAHTAQGLIGYEIWIFSTGTTIVGNVQAIDGLFMACTRKVVEAVRFDERSFDGWHLYDLDFSYSAYLAGFRLGVCNDISIIHASRGLRHPSCETYARHFEQKYRDKLNPMKVRPFCFSVVRVPTKEEVLEVMAGGCGQGA
jgi:GT2 family glycosyltransferase